MSMRPINNMAQKETCARGKRSYTDRAKETAVHIERIRSMLLARESKDNIHPELAVGTQVMR
jgi:hypothetical protein